MGQRANPILMRLGINQSHRSIWFASDKRELSRFLLEDYEIRQLIETKFRKAGVSDIIISRGAKIQINIFAKMVGHIIGKQGKVINELKAEIERLINEEGKIYINVTEAARPNLDAKIVANDIAMMLEERSGGFKSIAKRTIQTVLRDGAKGIKIRLKGRLGGSEIARTEPFGEGSVPLQTLTAKISYAQSTAHTKAGSIGVTVWIYSDMHHGKYNPFEYMSDRTSVAASNKLKSQQNVRGRPYSDRRAVKPAAPSTES